MIIGNGKLLNIQIDKAKCYTSGIKSSLVITYNTFGLRTCPTSPSSIKIIVLRECELAELRSKKNYLPYLRNFLRAQECLRELEPEAQQIIIVKTVVVMVLTLKRSKLRNRLHLQSPRISRDPPSYSQRYNTQYLSQMHYYGNVVSLLSLQ